MGRESATGRKEVKMKGFRTSFVRQVKVKAPRSGQILGTKAVRVSVTQIKKPRLPK